MLLLVLHMREPLSNSEIYKNDHREIEIGLTLWQLFVYCGADFEISNQAYSHKTPRGSPSLAILTVTENVSNISFQVALCNLNT